MRLHVPSLCHSLQCLGCQRDLEQACFFHIAEEGVTGAHGGETEVQRKQGPWPWWAWPCDSGCLFVEKAMSQLRVHEAGTHPRHKKEQQELFKVSCAAASPLTALFFLPASV